MASEESERETIIGPMQVGRKATVKLVRHEEYYVDIEMPVDGDPEEQAGLHVWQDTPCDDYMTVHAEIVEEEPLYEDDFEREEDWPSHV